MKIILIIVTIFLINFPINTRDNLSKKEIRVTLQPSVISLDPGGVQDSQSLFVSRQVNCQLVRNQGSTFILDAAASIKYISPLQIVLKISDKAKFHDGTLITSKDVIASFNYIKVSRNIFKNIFFWIDKIEIKNDKVIMFTLKKHIPQFLKALSSINFTIFKKSFLQKAKKDKLLWKNPLGCGGYRVAKFSDNQIKLAPVSDGLPITFDLINSNQIYASEAAKYDIVTVQIIGDSKELSHFYSVEMLDPLQFFIGTNSKSKLWKSKSNRCEFLASLDTTSLVASYGGVAIEANDLLPKGVLGYSVSTNYNHKVAAFAKKSGIYEPHIKQKKFCLAYLTVSIQKNKKNEFLNMIKKQYPNIILKPIENVKRFGKKFISDNCDALLFALRSNYLDGYEFLTVFENNDANFSGLYNKALEERILQSQVIENTSERAIEYQQISKEIRDLCIVRPLFTLPIRKVYIRTTLQAPGIGLIPIYQYYLGNIFNTRGKRP